MCLLLSRGSNAQDAANLSAGVESYRDFTLSNGLRVVIAVDRRVPQVALHIAYAVGDALDPPEQRGIAQLIGKLLPTLDTRHLRAAERPRLLQAAGFKFEAPNASVGLDTTNVTLQVPAEALELALWIEADRMAYASDDVSEQALQRALPQVAELVESAPNNPDSLVGFRAALGPLHPYGAADRAANLASLTSSAVAARLRRYYNPASAALVLVGDVDATAAEQAVRRLFGPLPSAPLTPLPNVKRPAQPQLVSLTSPLPKPFAALAWETPPYLAPDDAELDVVAAVLVRRLEARKLCDKISVSQRSRRLTSVFFASCEGPTTSTDAWHAAFDEELAALAEGHVPAAEIDSAALLYQVNTSGRYDHLQGRAGIIASSVLNGCGAQIVPQILQAYGSTDAARVAAVVRRHLLRPADGQVENTRGVSAAISNHLNHESRPTFNPPVETTTLKASDIDWPRPPANGAPHRFEPPTGPSETLSNGDRLRFMAHVGVPVAHVKMVITWPTQAINAAARPVLAKLLEESPVEGMTLAEKLRSLGAKLEISGFVDDLEIVILAPSSRLEPALDALSTVLAEKELPKEKFNSAKASTGAWVKRDHDQLTWYWDALGLSAMKTRYEYLSPNARKTLVEQLKLTEVARLWQATARQPRDVNLVGPFDDATARTFETKLTGPATARTPLPRTPSSAPFHAGVYAFDREAPKSGTADVDVCVLWPLPLWATPAYFPAHLMPWFFRTELEDGLGARLSEHHARVPYWNSATLINRDQDFLRYSFRTSVDQLGPVLESLKVHLARLGEGHFSAMDFANAIADERQFQMRQALSGGSISYALYRAAMHGEAGNDALDIALQVERVTPQNLSQLAKTLTLEGATIGVVGPIANVSEGLKTLGLKPTTVVKLETKTIHEGTSAQ